MENPFIGFIREWNKERRLDTPWVRVRLSDGEDLFGKYCRWLYMPVGEEENYWVSLSKLGAPAIEIRFQTKDCIEVEEIDVEDFHLFECVEFTISHPALKKLEALWQQSKHRVFNDFLGEFLEETLNPKQS